MGISKRHYLIAIVAAMALSISVISQSLAATGWADPVRVWSTSDNPGQWAVPIGLVRTGVTSVVAGYVRFSSSSSVADVFVRGSVDDGVTWADPVQVSLPSAGSASASISGYGQNVDVVWGYGAVIYARSTDGGVTFSTPVALADGDGGNSPVVARGPDGLVAIAWEKHARHSDKVFVSVSHDGGQTFSPRQTLWTPSYQSAPAVAVGDGIVYVANAGSNHDIKLRQSDDGLTWSSSRALGVVYNDVGPVVTLTATDDDVYVAYSRLTSNGFVPSYRRSADRGATWSARRALAQPSAAVSTPVMSIDNGVVRASFGRGPVVNSQGYLETIYKDSLNGVTWSRAVHVSDSPLYWAYPAGVAETDRTLVLYVYCVQGEYGCNIDVRGGPTH